MSDDLRHYHYTPYNGPLVLNPPTEKEPITHEAARANLRQYYPFKREWRAALHQSWQKANASFLRPETWVAISHLIPWTGSWRTKIAKAERRLEAIEGTSRTANTGC